MKAKSSKISGYELTWYIIALVFGAAGLFGVVFHFVGEILKFNNVEPQFNPVILSNDWWMSWSKMGWLYWGMIFIGVSLLLFVATCCYNAKKSDRDYDKEQRRLQRLESVSQEDVVPAVKEENVAK